MNSFFFHRFFTSYYLFLFPFLSLPVALPFAWPFRLPFLFCALPISSAFCLFTCLNLIKVLQILTVPDTAKTCNLRIRLLICFCENPHFIKCSCKHFVTVPNAPTIIGVNINLYSRYINCKFRIKGKLSPANFFQNIPYKGFILT